MSQFHNSGFDTLLRDPGIETEMDSKWICPSSIMNFFSGGCIQFLVVLRSSGAVKGDREATCPFPA